VPGSAEPDRESTALAFDLIESLQRYGHESTRAAGIIAGGLDSRGSFDSERGRVDIDRDSIGAAIRSATPSKARAVELADWTTYLAEGGLATVPGPSEPSLIPWRVLEDLAVAGQGTTPGLRDFYGVDVGASSRKAAAQLHKRFPGLSEDVFPPGTAGYLARDTEIGGGLGGNGEGRPRPGGSSSSSPSRPSAGGIVRVQPAAADVEAAGRCFAHGMYTGIDGGNSFGSWLLGFRVCFDHACAQTIGATLTWLNPATQIDPTELGLAIGRMLESALDEILKLKSAIFDQPIPSLEPLITWLIFVLFAGVPLLGDWITKADAGRGVCLCFSWFGVFWVMGR
jgi:hypothetical protein